MGKNFHPVLCIWYYAKIIDNIAQVSRLDFEMQFSRCWEQYIYRGDLISISLFIVINITMMSREHHGVSSHNKMFKLTEKETS